MRSEDELRKLIDEETEQAERTRDEPMVRGVRRNANRTKLFAVRFTPEEFAEIQRLAESAGVPASSLVRRLVLAGMAAEGGESVASAVEALERDVDRLKRHLVDA